MQDITLRRDSLWTVQFIQNSRQLIHSGDSLAVALFQQYNQTFMPAYTNFSDEEMARLMHYFATAYSLLSKNTH